VETEKLVIKPSQKQNERKILPVELAEAGNAFKRFLKTSWGWGVAEAQVARSARGANFIMG
jgi:hypothetical protein